MQARRKMTESAEMVEGYAIVLARRVTDKRIVRCGIKIDVPATMLTLYRRRNTLHAMTIKDTIPPGLTIEWCSEWRRGVYSHDEPLGGWNC